MASRSDEASPSFALPADSSGNPLLPPDANEDFHFDGHISNDVELLRQVKEKTERRRRKWGEKMEKQHTTHTHETQVKKSSLLPPPPPPGHGPSESDWAMRKKARLSNLTSPKRFLVRLLQLLRNEITHPPSPSPPPPSVSLFQTLSLSLFPSLFLFQWFSVFFPSLFLHLSFANTTVDLLPFLRPG